MADGVELDIMSGGATVATDEISGEHYQRFKLTIGNDGTADGDVYDGRPLPVNVGTITAGTVEVSSLPNITVNDIGGGTIDSVSELVAGTVGVNFLQDLPGGTIDSITNLAAGTVTSVQGGSIAVTSIPTVSINDVPGGTIDSITALPDLPGGTVDVVSSVANIAGGTIQQNPTPSRDILTTSTTTGDSAATAVTLVAAPGSGTSIFVTALSIINSDGTVACQIGFGTPESGTTVLERGNFGPQGGISQQYPQPVGGAITNTALTAKILAAGTATFNVKYYVE